MKKIILFVLFILVFTFSNAYADDAKVKIKLSRDNKGYKYVIESDDADKVLEVNEKLKKGLFKPQVKVKTPQKPKVQ